MTNFAIPINKTGPNWYQWNFINESSQNVVVNLTTVVPFFESMTEAIYNGILLPANANISNPTPANSYAGGDISLLPHQTLTVVGYIADLNSFNISTNIVPSIFINQHVLTSNYTEQSGVQTIDMLGRDGFTVTENARKENNASGNGVQIQLGGAGYKTTVENIDYQIFDQTTGTPDNHHHHEAVDCDLTGNIFNITLPTIKSKGIQLSHYVLVNSFYEGFLGRTPDSDGFYGWFSQLRSGMSAISIGESFILSAEYLNKINDTSSFVDILYHDILNRTADTGGKSYWINQIASGMSRAAVADSFLHSSEYVSLIGSPTHDTHA